MSLQSPDLYPHPLVAALAILTVTQDQLYPHPLMQTAYISSLAKHLLLPQQLHLTETITATIAQCPILVLARLTTLVDPIPTTLPLQAQERSKAWITLLRVQDLNHSPVTIHLLLSAHPSEAPIYILQGQIVYSKR